MSIIISGDNNFNNVPFVPAEQSPWPELIENAPPVLEHMIAMGLSALQHGIESSGETVRQEFLAKPSLDKDGEVEPSLYRALHMNSYPREEHEDAALGGVAITAVATSIAYLLRNDSTGRIFTNNDYRGPTGVQFVRRDLVLPVAEDQKRYVAGQLNVGRVSAVKARLFAETSDYYPASFTLTLANVTGTSSAAPGIAGSSSTLHVKRDSADIVSAQILDSERDGDFGFVPTHSSFAKLFAYARVIRKLTTIEASSPTQAPAEITSPPPALPPARDF